MCSNIKIHDIPLVSSERANIKRKTLHGTQLNVLKTLSVGPYNVFIILCTVYDGGSLPFILIMTTITIIKKKASQYNSVHHVY